MEEENRIKTPDTPPMPTILYIPNIPEEKLLELYSNIRPIVKIDGKKYLLKDFKPEELREHSYIWDADKDKREIVEEETLEIIQDFHCLHTWAYYGVFKPTIAEVLAQMPIESREQANFFEIVDQPRTVDDLSRNQVITDAGYHLSIVRTYKINEER